MQLPSSKDKLLNLQEKTILLYYYYLVVMVHIVIFERKKLEIFF